MYQNIELIMNPSITPVYTTATNMVLPILTIGKDALYEHVVKLGTFLKHFLYFMWEKGVTFWNETNINYDNLFIICMTTFLIGFIFYDKYMFTHVCYNPLARKVKEMEQEINVMKKAERMRDNDWELLMQSQSQGFKQLQATFDKKFKDYDKQMKKMDKEIKMYE
jgi:hypothetical protein